VNVKGPGSYPAAGFGRY